MGDLWARREGKRTQYERTGKRERRIARRKNEKRAKVTIVSIGWER
jgi:hypothetical protein